MTDIAIRVEALSKLYRIGERQAPYHSLRETLVTALSDLPRRVMSIFRGSTTLSDNRDNTIWALKDVSFEIGRGEVVGIIGGNGAGKSTLLKILSRITEPTTGYAEIHGRVGSLLEVGTGFHGELTGRENIYLNGAILGMRRTEISRKFDDIVAFAEVEKFIDTPVKHYSTGMYLRLAFAVAAYLEPEILIVDEVLAVGDAKFQRKCLDKMEDVGHQGRTVLLVSHNMSAITRMCNRAVLINHGKVVKDGPPSEVASTYLSSELTATATREWPDLTSAPRGEVARLCAVRVRNEDGQITDTIDIRRPLLVEMEYEVLKSGFAMYSHFQFFNEESVHVFSAHDLDPSWRRRPRPEGRYVSRVEIPGNFLSAGKMFVGAGLNTVEPPTLQFYQRDLVVFQVIESGDGDTARGEYAGQMGGVVRPLLKWSTECAGKIDSGVS